MFWLWFVICWFALSVLVGLVVGPFIRFGMEGDDRTLDEMDEKRTLDEMEEERTLDEMDEERDDYLRKMI